MNEDIPTTKTRDECSVGGNGKSIHYYSVYEEAKHHDDLTANSQDQREKAWIQEIATNGCATCPVNGCHMKFRDVRNMSLHLKQCTGISRPVNSNTCELCHKQFTSPHMLNDHSCVIHESNKETNGIQNLESSLSDGTKIKSLAEKGEIIFQSSNDSQRKQNRTVGMYQRMSPVDLNMSEIERYTPELPPHPTALYYVQGNLGHPQELLNIQSSMYRIPIVKPCLVPQSLHKNENVTSYTRLGDRHEVVEFSNQSQGFSRQTQGDASELCLSKQSTDNSVQKLNMQSVYPSTSGIKRKWEEVPQRNVHDHSKSCKCSHDDSYTTGYTSDDSEEDNMLNQRCKSRTHPKLTLKPYPSSFGKSEVHCRGGRPLFRDKPVKDALVQPKQSPSCFKHFKREPDFKVTNKTEMGPMWEEEKKLQLAVREQQIFQAEEAVKQQEEEAHECLRRALQQQEMALNEREEVLRHREAAVQKKFEQATKLLEESRKIVDSKKFKSSKGVCSVLPSNFDGHTRRTSFTLQLDSGSNHENTSTNFDKNVSIMEIQEHSNPESKEMLMGLGNESRCRSFSESKLSVVGRKFEPNTGTFSSSQLPKTMSLRSDTFPKAVPKLEIPLVPSPTSCVRNPFLSEVRDSIKRSPHVVGKCENAPNLELSKVVRTYTRTNRCRTTSEMSGSSPLVFNTDASVPPRAHSVAPITKVSFDCKSVSRGVAVRNEETVINGGASVTITPLATDDRPPRPFSAIPKLEGCRVSEADDNPDQTEKLPFSASSSTMVELKPKEVSSVIICDKMTKETVLLDHRVEVLPPKTVSVKPVPPIDKCGAQKTPNVEFKSEVTYQSQDGPVKNYITDSKKDIMFAQDTGSLDKVSLRDGKYPGKRSSIDCGKKGLNLSMETLAVISIPSNEKKCVVSQEEKFTQREGYDLPIVHGSCKLANPSKVSCNTTGFPGDENEGLGGARNWSFDTKDTSEATRESTYYLQSVDTLPRDNTRESTVVSKDQALMKSNAPHQAKERKSQSFARAQNNQRLLGGPFLPGDIFYTPINKLNHQTSTAQKKFDSTSPNLSHSSLALKQTLPSPAIVHELKQTSFMPSHLPSFPKEAPSSDSKLSVLNLSSNPGVPLLGDQSAESYTDTYSPNRTDVKYVSSTSTSGELSVTSVYGAAYNKPLPLVVTASSQESLSLQRKHSAPPVTHSEQLTTSSQVAVHSASERHPPQISYLIDQQVLALPDLGTHSQKMLSKQQSLLPSSLSLSSNTYGSSTNSQILTPQQDLKEGQHKPLLNRDDDDHRFLTDSQNSQKLAQILVVSSDSSQGLQLSQDATQSEGGQAESQIIQLDQDSQMTRVGNMSQVVSMSQQGLLEVQELKSGGSNQWPSVNYGMPTSEALTNLGDYDPVSKTLTTSNPIFLQSILGGSVSVSTGYGSNSQINPDTDHPVSTGGKVAVRQTSVQLQTDGILSDENQKNESSIHAPQNFMPQSLDKDQGDRTMDDNEKIVEHDDPSGTGVRLLGSRARSISGNVELRSGNENTTLNSHCASQTLSDADASNDAALKFTNVTSDTSRNFSDCESELSRTGDHFFISTGILGSQDLSKTTSSLQDEYLDVDDDNLNDDCFSDSDNECKIEATGMAVSSQMKNVGELKESNRFSKDVMAEGVLESESDQEKNTRTNLKVERLSDITSTDITPEGVMDFVSEGLGIQDSHTTIDNQNDREEDIENVMITSDCKVQKSSGVSPLDSGTTLAVSEEPFQESEKGQNMQNEFELLSCSSYPSQAMNKGEFGDCEVTEATPKMEKKTPWNRSRGRRGRGRSKGRGKSRGRQASIKNSKLEVFGHTPHEVSDVSSKILSAENDGLSNGELPSSFSEADLPGNGTKSGLSVNSEIINESTYKSDKEKKTRDDYFLESKPELEKFEHVSHSGRKLKLKSYLKAVYKGNYQKTRSSNKSKLLDHSVVLKPPVKQRKPKKSDIAEKNINFEGIEQHQKVYGMKAIKQNHDNFEKDSKLALVKKVAVNIKCGKCDHISESVAKFNSHIQHEHNGLARPDGESQEFSEDEWKVILCQTMKSIKKMKCEKCFKIFRSLPGYKNHVKFCGHSIEEVLTNCPICSRPIRQHNLRTHIRKYHEKKKQKQPDITTAIDTPRPRRKAATNCNAKLKVWRSNPAEVAGSDSSDLEEDSDNEIGIGKFYVKESIQIPTEVKAKWEVDFSSGGKASCQNFNCTYIFKNLKKARIHFVKCPFSNVIRNYKCKICDFSCVAVVEIRNHVSNRHKAMADSVMGSDCELSEEETGSINNRYWNKPRIGGKALMEQLRPFEQALSWTLDFILENYSEQLFPDLSVSYKDWLLLSADEALKFKPPVNDSPKFKISKISKVDQENKCTDWQVLQQFSGTSVFEGFALFSGGPTLASAWCPQSLKDSANAKFQYLALSAASSTERNYCVMKSYSHEGLIQIWKSSCCRENGPLAPNFEFGIAHDYGSVWSLVWCPSGIYDMKESDSSVDKANLQRMGLLAAACSDGTVRIFVIPNPSLFELQDTSRIFRVKPAITLRSSVVNEGDAQCLKVDWFRGKGHESIAGAFSTGFVCIWDLSTSSPLLRVTEPRGLTIYPVNCFLAHNGVCSTVSFCPTTGSRNLLTGGNDRTYKFWDLENTNMPLNITRKGLVTDSFWLSHWAGCFVSFDDVYGLSNTNTCYRENGFYGIHSRNVLSSNSPVWTISASEWLNTVVQGDSSGEVVITVQQQLFKNYENEKVPSKRKVPLLGVHIEKLSQATPVSFRVCQDTKIQGSIEKSTKVKFPRKNKKGQLSAQGERESMEEDGLCPAVYLDLPRTYSETCEGYGVVFTEQDCQYFTNIPEAQLAERKRSERMEPGPVACYPLMSATSVSWNNNFESHTWVFVGTQSGLCRLVNVEALKNENPDFVKMVRRKIEKMKPLVGCT